MWENTSSTRNDPLPARAGSASCRINPLLVVEEKVFILLRSLKVIRLAILVNADG